MCVKYEMKREWRKKDLKDVSTNVVQTHRQTYIHTHTDITLFFPTLFGFFFRFLLLCIYIWYISMTPPNINHRTYRMFVCVCIYMLC